MSGASIVHQMSDFALKLTAHDCHRFDIMASIAKTATDAEALLFTMIMQKVQEDLEAAWC
jgi:hypothetical protein